MPANHTPYLRPSTGEVSAEIEIKRSRFIALVQRTGDEEEARSFINDVTSRYPDARHHCTAYILQQDQALPIERSNDDGEPSGTAGQPILEVLRGTEMRDVTVVVVRYFGGVKLGTGGLVRAYQDATKKALEQVKRVRRTPLWLYTVHAEHAEAGKWEAELRGEGVEIISTEFGADVEMTLGVGSGERDRLESAVARLSGGSAELQEAGHRWVDQPV